MPRGGYRPGSGRKKFEPNKPVRELQSQARSQGAKQSMVETMIYKRDYWMLRVQKQMEKPERPANPPKDDKGNYTPPLSFYRDEDIVMRALDKANEAAREAAPYLHRKLASVTHTEVPYDLSRLTDEQLAQLERLSRVAAISDEDSGRDSATQH